MSKEKTLQDMVVLCYSVTYGLVPACHRSSLRPCPTGGRRGGGWMTSKSSIKDKIRIWTPRFGQVRGSTFR